MGKPSELKYLLKQDKSFLEKVKEIMPKEEREEKEEKILSFWCM